MFLLAKIGFMILGVALCAFGGVSVIKPKKVVDFYNRDPRPKYIREIQDDLFSIKTRVIVTRIKGVFFIVIGIAFIVIDIVKVKR
jgi:hypothetical protein